MCDALELKGLNSDRQVGLIFEDKKDARDERPLLYPARIVVAAGADLGLTMWNSSDLLRYSRTEAAQFFFGGALILPQRPAGGGLSSATASAPPVPVAPPTLVRAR